MNRFAARLITLLAMICCFALLPGAAQATTVHCGDTITQDTTLTNDVLNCPSVGLTIAANGITINLNGHTISGEPSAQSGINDSTGHDQLKIVGPGTVQGFGFG